MMERTRTERASSPDGGPGPRLVSYLIRVGQSHRPRHPEPRIIDLGLAEQLQLGRGDTEQLEPAGAAGYRWAIADPWMSGDHAVVVRQPGDPPAYDLVDHHSTNGSFINGRRVSRQRLADGDMVEIGQNFFRFLCGAVQDPAALLELAYTGGPVLPTASSCPALLDLFSQLEDIAPTRIPLVLLGESGTGKEVMTSVIHQRSGRPGQFVALNCAAIPEGLIESELFGHRKGAFTGALADKKGLVEEAQQGTLLMDEIGDMPLAAQAKVLRLLQEQTFTRVGETRVRKADVRFIAATHRDLEAMVQQQTFRGDLFARLNGLTLQLPALRQRKEDLGILLSFFLQRHAADRLTLEHEVYRALMLYDWPFNIRELEKTVETAAALSRRGGKILRTHLPASIQQVLEPAAAAPAAAPLPATFTETVKATIPRNIDDDELRSRLEQVLTAQRGNISAVARELGHTRKQIHRWMQRVGLDPESFRV